MNTSVSDVSISDFNDSRKVNRKRKRKIAPLIFEADPMDSTFYSPDRPRAAQNPIGADVVDVLCQSNAWICLDEFRNTGLPVTRRRTVKRVDTLPDVCTKRDCAHPHHKHMVTPRKPPVDISDNDSDLLLSVDEKDTEVASPPTHHIPEPQQVSTPVSKQYFHIPPTPTSPTPVFIPPAPDSPTITPIFKKVGYSQCKSAKSKLKTRTRLDEIKNQEIRPISPDKENRAVSSDTKRVVINTPDTGRTPVSRLKQLNTPDSGKGTVYVEDTPEHLVGLRMVTRRLRGILGAPVSETQGIP